jgi:hypothetical protein
MRKPPTSQLQAIAARIASIRASGLNHIENAKRTLQFHKGNQLPIGTHDEPISVAAMCVSDRGCSPFRIQS